MRSSAYAGTGWREQSVWLARGQLTSRPTSPLCTVLKTPSWQMTSQNPLGDDAPEGRPDSLMRTVQSPHLSVCSNLCPDNLAASAPSSATLCHRHLHFDTKAGRLHLATTVCPVRVLQCARRASPGSSPCRRASISWPCPIIDRECRWRLSFSWWLPS